MAAMSSVHQLMVALKREGLLMMRRGCILGDKQSYCKCSKWPPGSHSHAGSQALDKVRHHIVNMFLWQLFPDGLQGGFQLISRLMVGLEFMVFFQHMQTRTW